MKTLSPEYQILKELLRSEPQRHHMWRRRRDVRDVHERPWRRTLNGHKIKQKLKIKTEQVRSDNDASEVDILGHFGTF